MKKGFTLIELLAVIVILAVIALIATPIMNNVIIYAKEKAAKDDMYGYIKSIENQILEDEANVVDVSIPDGEYNNLVLINNNIKSKGKLPTIGNLTILDGEVTSAVICFRNFKVNYDGNNITKIEKSNDCN